MLQPASIVERVHQGLNHLKAAFSQSNFQAQKHSKSNFKGQSLVETSLVMGLVGVVCIGTVATLGGNISSLIAEANGSTAPTTALVSSNPNMVNQNLQAPNTTSAGLINGQKPLGTTGGSTQNTVETVTAAGGGLLEAPPSETTIDNPTGGGPIGPVANPAGNGAGTAVTKPTLQQQQQFSPEYQSFRDKNPNLVNMINLLSADSQKIANQVFSDAATNGINSEVLFKLQNHNYNSSDQRIVNQIVDHFHSQGNLTSVTVKDE